MRLVAAIVTAALAGPANAGPAEIVSAEVDPVSDGRYRVSATVRHADEGWDHYANAFEVLAPDGTLLGTRTLHHPHVEEQPFTRSLTLAIPDGIAEVSVRASDSVHGRGGAAVTIRLPDRAAQ